MSPEIQWQVAGSAPENYETYLVPAIFEPWGRDLLEIAALRPGERVLDVACGTGIVARLAAETVGAPSTVVGVDINPGMLSTARKISPTIDWREGNVTALPLADATFNVAICQQGLQFFPDRAAALREIHRVLTPQGRLAVACWKGIQHSPGFLALAEALAKHAGPEAAAIARGPFALGDEGELRSVIAGAGFKDIAVHHRTKMLTFPSGEEFVRRYGTGSPLAPVMTKMNTAALGGLVNDVSTTLLSHRGAKGLEFPIEAHLVLARK
ncbi:MAG TPA: methyltransferase domain-containing protein [Vicinamibacterales bacterium]|nr:methyltransferase domain-containing protein [Vicinamibacterales bacterium]